MPGRIAVTLAGSLLSGLYWLAFFFLAEAFTAGDQRAGAGIGEVAMRARAAAAIVIGVVGYAFCMAAWRRITR